MRTAALVLVVAFAFLSVPASLSAVSPAALEPGGSPEVQQIAEPCPAFSWTPIEQAASYQLQIFRLTGDTTEAWPEPALVAHVEVPSGSVSWTPAPGDCLAGGQRYAWSIRAELRDASFSEWSRVRLFEVLAGPSVTELEDALGIVPRSEDSAAERMAASPSSRGDLAGEAVQRPLPDQVIAKAVPPPVFVLDGAIEFADGTRLSTSPVWEGTTVQTLSIAGSALRPRASDTEWSSSGSGGCLYASSGDAWQVFNTAVYLPQGVTVKSLRLHYYDTDATMSNSYAWFTAYDLEGNLALEWYATSSGSGGNGFSDSTAINHVVDHSTYRYLVNWRPTVLGSTMQVCGVQIYYVRE